MLWWLAQNTVMAALLAVVVLTLCRLCRFSPAVRHALWLVVLLKLLTPPLILWPWSLPGISYSPAAAPPVDSERSIAVSEPLAGLPDVANVFPDLPIAPVEFPAAADNATPVIPDSALSSPAPPAQRDLPPWPEVFPLFPFLWDNEATAVARLSSSPPPQQPAIAGAASTLPAGPPPPPPSQAFSFEPIIRVAPKILFGLWLCGTIMIAAVQLVRVARFHRQAAKAKPAPSCLTRQVETLASRLRVRPPRTGLLSKIASPFLWCLGRPKLLWPTVYIGSFGNQSRRGLIAHELAHLRRREHWVIWLQVIATCIWWWNPLYWFIRSRLRETGELACDAWVVRLMPNQRRIYAEALIEASQLASRTPAPMPALGMSLSARAVFEKRLTMIMRDSVPCAISRLGLVAIGLLALIVLPCWPRSQETALEGKEEAVQADEDVSHDPSLPREEQIRRHKLRLQQLLERRRKVAAEREREREDRRALQVDLEARQREIEGLRSPAHAAAPAQVEAEGGDDTRDAVRLLFDDFDDVLSLEWDILHPDASHYSLDRKRGALTIVTQAGSFSWGHNSDYKNLFLVDCPEAQGQDLRITTCVSGFVPERHWNQVGILFHCDDDNYVKCCYQTYYGPRIFGLITETNGSRRNVVLNQIADGFERVWLRLTKRGTTYELSTSLDGRSFTRQGEAHWDGGPVKKVGLFALNGSGTEAPKLEASFEFFEVAAVPARAPARAQAADKGVPPVRPSVQARTTVADLPADEVKISGHDFLAWLSKAVPEDAKLQRVTPANGDEIVVETRMPAWNQVVEFLPAVEELPGVSIRALTLKTDRHREEGIVVCMTVSLAGDAGRARRAEPAQAVASVAVAGRPPESLRIPAGGFSVRLLKALPEGVTLEKMLFQGDGDVVIDAFTTETLGADQLVKAVKNLPDVRGVSLSLWSGREPKNAQADRGFVVRVTASLAGAGERPPERPPVQTGPVVGVSEPGRVGEIKEALRQIRAIQIPDLQITDLSTSDRGIRMRALSSRQESIHQFVSAVKAVPGIEIVGMTTTTQAGRRDAPAHLRVDVQLEVGAGPLDRAGAAARVRLGRKGPLKCSIPEGNLKVPDGCKGCAQNLKKIYEALLKYERESGTVPSWLSDLVPDCLSTQALLCPADPAHTSQYWPDPKLPCSYAYELCTGVIPGRPPAGGKSMREYKDLQHEVFGDVVPIVRCFHHDDVLNLAWKGNVYTSAAWFERMFIPKFEQKMLFEAEKSTPRERVVALPPQVAPVPVAQGPFVRSGPAPKPSTARKSKVLARDDFQDVLSLEWDIVNSDKTHYSLGKKRGSLTITTQDGHFSRSNENYANVFLIDSPAGKGDDFMVTTCVDFQPVEAYNEAGLVCWDDEDNYIKWVYEFATRRTFTACVETDAADDHSYYPAMEDFQRIWLRMTKQERDYALSTSTDGKTFTTRATLTWGNGSPKKVGLFANNGSLSNPPEIDASFDYFEVAGVIPAAAPVVEVAAGAARVQDANAAADDRNTSKTDILAALSKVAPAGVTVQAASFNRRDQLVIGVFLPQPRLAEALATAVKTLPGVRGVSIEMQPRRQGDFVARLTVSLAGDGQQVQGPEVIYNPGPIASTGKPVTVETPLKAGDVLQAKWNNGSWWAARVLAVQPDGQVKIHYIGWVDAYDEIVPRDRLQLDPETEAKARATKPPRAVAGAGAVLAQAATAERIRSGGRTHVPVAEVLRRFRAQVAGAGQAQAMVAFPGGPQAAVRFPMTPRTSVARKGDVLARDEFEDVLSLEWDILNADKTHYSLDRKRGTLTITTQDGHFKDGSSNYKNVFLVDAPAPGGRDYMITTCLSGFQPQGAYNQAGLLCWNDEDDYIEWIYQYMDRGLIFAAGVEERAPTRYDYHPASGPFEKLWLRLTKRGNSYECSWSLDGELFTVQSMMEWGDGAPKKVGLFAINGGMGSPPEVDAPFDFFEVAAVGPAAAPVAAAARENRFAFDDFDTTLSLTWETRNPDPSHVSLTQTTGCLTITTQEGAFSETHTNYKNLFLVDVPEAAGDEYRITTRLSKFAPRGSRNQAGLVCWSDEDNFLKWAYEFYKGRNAFTVVQETGGETRPIQEQLEQGLETVWLRISKEGKRYTFSKSLDGEDYTDLRVIEWTGPPLTKVGLVALNGPEPIAPEVHAAFDFFEVAAVGIRPGTLILPKELSAAAVARAATIPEENLEIPAEMQDCAKHLQKLHAAMARYRRDKGDLPGHLSDLVPDYLAADDLLCPTHRAPSVPSLTMDPNLPCSYGYQISATADGGDRRPLKVAQLRLFGPVVPLLRCYSHGQILNIAFDGKLFWSGNIWETMFPGYPQGLTTLRAIVAQGQLEEVVQALTARQKADRARPEEIGQVERQKILRAQQAAAALAAIAAAQQQAAQIAAQQAAQEMPIPAIEPVAPGAVEMPQKGKVLASDDFDRALSLEWDVLHPDATHYSLAKTSGALTITTQRGAFSYEHVTYKNLFLIDCPKEAGEDYMVTTCVSGCPGREAYNQAALVLWADEDNFLKWGYQGNRNNMNSATIGHEIGGDFTPASDLQVPQGMEKFWLRVVKRGNMYSFWISPDGKNYRCTRSIPWAGPPLDKLGLIAKSGTGDNAPQIDLAFEYFEVAALGENPKKEAAKPAARKSEGAGLWRALLNGQGGGSRETAVEPVSRETVATVARPARAAENGAVLAREDFDNVLGLEWDVVHPDATHYSLTKNPGKLTVTTQGGSFCLSRADYKNLFLIDNPATGDGDFQITLAVASFQPQTAYNQVGPICWDDEDNYIKGVYEVYTGPVFDIGAETNGRFDPTYSRATPGLSKVWLRLEKRGNRYGFFTSENGETFVRQGQATWGDGSPKRVGFIAKNGPVQGGPEVDAIIDSFEIATVPKEGGKVVAAQAAAPPAALIARTIPEKNLRIPDGMTSCAENLRRIGSALKKYQDEKGEWPQWLSDLVPDYLSSETLVCNQDKGAEPTEPPDPKGTCSYGYQLAPWKSPRTGVVYRTEKMKQLETYGTAMPLVRCRNHGYPWTVLNLTSDDRVYVSEKAWEGLFREQLERPAIAAVPAQTPAGTTEIPTPRRETGATLQTFAHPERVRSVAFSSDGSKILTGCSDGTARLWNTVTGELIRTFAGHDGEVPSVALAADGTKVLTAGYDRTAKLWNAETGALLHTLEGHEGRVEHVAFSPDGTKALTAGYDRTARLWNVETGESIRTLTGHEAAVGCVAFSPDGSRFATASWDRTVKIWDAASSQAIRTLRGHTQSVDAVAFSPDGKKVVSCGSDATVRLWDLETGRQIRMFQGHGAMVLSLAISPDGTKIVTGGGDSTARLWDVGSGKELAMFPGHSRFVDAVAFSPDGTKVATGSWDRKARLFDVKAVLSPPPVAPVAAARPTPSLSPTRALPAASVAEFAETSGTKKVFDGEYLHRSRGADYLMTRLQKFVGENGAAYYTLNMRDDDYLLATDPEGRPRQYRYKSASGGYSGGFQFSSGTVVSRRKSTQRGDEEFNWSHSMVALPDFNSRPDPYLIQHALLSVYDFGEAGKQEFTVYDVDNQGTGINEYRLELELVDENGVELPNGVFKAKHLVQIQKSESGTWYKKWTGSKVEFWVNDDGIILRVHRHREPYEVILQNYNKPEDLLAEAPAPKPDVAWQLPPDASRYQTDMAAFVREIDRTYPFFDLKGIRDEWTSTSRQLLEKVKDCKSDPEFVELVLDGMRCLRDAHLGFRELKVKVPPRPPEYCLGISFLPAANDRVVVFYPRQGMDPDIKTGTVVAKIDGMDAREFIEKRTQAAWKRGGGYFSSPQRARIYEYRTPLWTHQRGEKHTITFRVGEKERDIELACDVRAGGWPRIYNMPENLKRVGRSTHYTQLPSGIAYVYLRRVDNSTGPGLKAAFAAYPDAKGWIIDLRGNSGGGYDQQLYEALKVLPRPMAVITDAGCISAGETLVRDFVHRAGARVFGTTTAGSSSSKRRWAFPSGIATLSLPTRSRFGVGGKLIEFYGVEPNETVEPDPYEMQRGLNSEILRAEEYLLKQLGETPAEGARQQQPQEQKGGAIESAISGGLTTTRGR